jgi:nitrite reductase/ring-hydroxylating ferredoxin subunit
MTQVSRRTVTSLATAGVSLPILAACSSDEDPGPTATDPGGGASSSTAGGADSPTEAGTSSGGGPSGFASTSDIEVGGGSIFSEEGVVVTQPTEGTFKGFSSTCTHQGCQVASVSDGVIQCPCHSSSFSIEDGSVQGGPASSPLPEVGLSVDGDSISLA